jgi:hypothetical protein
VLAGVVATMREAMAEAVLVAAMVMVVAGKAAEVVTWGAVAVAVVVEVVATV